MSESNVQKAIVEYLEAIGAWVRRLNVGLLSQSSKDKNGVLRIRYVKSGRKGDPDLLCFLNGKFIGIEVKRDEKVYNHFVKTVDKFNSTGVVAKSNKHIIEQYMALKNIGIHGGEWVVTYSVDHLKSQLVKLNIVKDGKKQYNLI
jgi:hypothetical protein